MKPFSVMLDIYPMMEESVLQTSSGPYKLQPRPMTRPDHGLGHHVRFSQGVNQERFPEQLTDSESKHQMVVHLNLYPKTKKNHKFGNRNADVRGFHVDAESNTHCCGSDDADNLRRSKFS
ncbi:uncharacterized protein LOC110837664 [Zootermopsis nevadensis]|uniref:uncharacterized protein LOC110837664 n=1 Tax=Zootermopsis nevadensis TaxID=136037 RepID=UPI000B8EB0A3|nr:uncharacterized protein LOC110837664 [Zootermopsis nevadensis]